MPLLKTEGLISLWFIDIIHNNSQYECDTDANRKCEIAFNDNAGGVGAYTGSQYREIQDLQQLTADGDLLIISQVLINDDATIYALGANDRGEEVIYRGTPLP